MKVLECFYVIPLKQMLYESLEHPYFENCELKITSLSGMEVLSATRSIQSRGGKKPGTWVKLPYVSRRKQVSCPGKDQVGAPSDSTYGSLLWKAELAGMEMQLTIDSKGKGLMKVKTGVLAYKPAL